MCDQSPWARTLSGVEFVSDFFYCNALATFPVFAVLVALSRQSAPRAERRAYAVATASALLTALLSTVAFGGCMHLLRSQCQLVRSTQAATSGPWRALALDLARARPILM